MSADNKPRNSSRRPTRAKAHQPDVTPIDPALADILNPAIARGGAGQTPHRYRTKSGVSTGLWTRMRQTPSPAAPRSRLR
jgi:hypothetical protein